MDVISHPALAHLHPTGHHVHPETPLRLVHLQERFPGYVHGDPAAPEDIERVHDPAYVAAIDSRASAAMVERGVLNSMPR